MESNETIPILKFNRKLRAKTGTTNGICIKDVVLATELQATAGLSPHLSQPYFVQNQ